MNFDYFDNKCKQQKQIEFSETEKNKLHGMCSYLAMFPRQSIEELIEEYSPPSEIVYDPFSGRGTTLLVSRMSGRTAIGNDLSPLAFVLSKSRVKKINEKKIFKIIDNLKNEYILNKNKYVDLMEKENDQKIKIFFEHKTLVELYFFREKLGKNFKKLNAEENFILAVLLGIMHGPRKGKNKKESSFLSIQMTNGFSVSPNYAKNYIQKNNLTYEYFDTFEKIKSRIKSNIPQNFYNLDFKGEQRNIDALKSDQIFKKNSKKPKLILTSPPYLNIVKYSKQNWIRMWIFGITNHSEIKLDDNHNLISYKLFLKNFLKSMEKILDEEGNLILLIGDVINKNHKMSINEILNEIVPETSFKYKILDKKEIFKNQKLSRSMGSKVGDATKIEWTFLLNFKENNALNSSK